MVSPFSQTNVIESVCSVAFVFCLTAILYAGRLVLSTCE